MKKRLPSNNFLAAQGTLDEAELLDRQSLEGKSRVPGDDYESTLNPMYSMSLLLHQQGNLSEAKPLCCGSPERYYRVLGKDHENTLNLICAMGNLLKAQGNVDRARDKERLADYEVALADEGAPPEQER